MALNPAFEHNGISIERQHAPPPNGPLGSVIIGLVGTAPDADPLLAKNTPHRISNRADAAKLDTTGNELGTLWQTIHQVLILVNVPFYVIIVDEDALPANTQTNIIGGVDAGTGQRTGIAALADCKEIPTHVCAPGFNAKPVADALVAQAAKLFAIPVGDGPGTNDEDAVTFSESLPGVGTGYDAYYLVDTLAHIYSRAALGNITFSGAAIALSCFARVHLWESPAKGGMGVLIEGTSRPIDYNIMDKSTKANYLLKHGINFFARTSLGGFSLIGNRSVTGRFINKTGLEYAIIRKLAATSQRVMGRNLAKSLIEQEITKLNTWLAGLALEETLIGAEVYLHPTLNTVDKYQNGEWHIAIKYAGFSPNEHMVYHLIEDDGITAAYLEELI